MATAIIAVALVAIVSVVSVTLFLRSVYESSLVVSREAQDRLRVANDRLYGAWREGHTIPAVAPADPAPPDPLEPLIPELQALVNDWEDERGQESMKKVIYQMMATGLTQMEVARKIAPDMFQEPAETE